MSAKRQNQTSDVVGMRNFAHKSRRPAEEPGGVAFFTID
jgi:hypothetical protein